MKVLQVLAGAAYGGAETAFEDIVQALAAAGLNQKVVTRSNNPERVKKLQQAGLDVITLPFGGALDLYTPWRMKQIIAEYQPHIVQTWMSRATQKTPASDVPKKYLKVARLGGYYNLKYFKGTDYFVAITPDIRDYLIKEGVAADHAVVLNNFANVETVTTSVRRADLQTPEDATVILALSRYHQAKALDVLIAAAAEIDNVHLWLAGEGPLESDLRKQATDLGIADRVHFLGWRTDRGALLQAADICVFPSRHEPFGTVFVQAWAQQTPVICSRSQGPSQYVRDGEDGLLFDIDNVSQLADCIRKISSDKGLGDRLAQAGYQRYLGEFERLKIVDHYMTFYRDILRREGMLGNQAEAA